MRAPVARRREVVVDERGLRVKAIPLSAEACDELRARVLAIVGCRYCHGLHHLREIAAATGVSLGAVHHFLARGGHITLVSRARFEAWLADVVAVTAPPLTLERVHDVVCVLGGALVMGAEHMPGANTSKECERIFREIGGATS